MPVNSTTRFWIITAVFGVAAMLIDQWTKHIARLYLDVPVPVIENFLWLETMQNRNIAFGLPVGNAMMMLLIPIILCLLCWYVGRSVASKWRSGLLAPMVFGFILGAGVGNYIDRIIFGSVTDFVASSFWPTFNAADALLTIAAFVLIIFHGKILKDI